MNKVKIRGQIWGIRMPMAGLFPIEKSQLFYEMQTPISSTAPTIVRMRNCTLQQYYETNANKNKVTQTQTPELRIEYVRSLAILGELFTFVVVLRISLPL